MRIGMIRGWRGLRMLTNPRLVGNQADFLCRQNPSVVEFEKSSENLERRAHHIDSVAIGLETVAHQFRFDIAATVLFGR